MPLDSPFHNGFTSERPKQVTLERFESEEFLKPHVRGFPPAFRRSTFLLAPGGQDYVGENSYDEVSRVDE